MKIKINLSFPSIEVDYSLQKSFWLKKFILGGTFTDVFCITPNGKIITEKFLSENPSNYPDAPTYAIKKIISQVFNIKKNKMIINNFFKGDKFSDDRWFNRSH